MHQRFGTHESIERGPLPWCNCACLPLMVGQCRWNTLRGNCAERSIFISVQDSELRLAKTNRVRQQGLERWRKLTRRTGDDLEHLGGRGLLLHGLGQKLSRFSKFAGLLLKLVLKISIGRRATTTRCRCSTALRLFSLEPSCLGCLAGRVMSRHSRHPSFHEYMIGPKRAVGTVIESDQAHACPPDFASDAAVRGRTIRISVNAPSSVSTSIEPACCFTMMS
jgi:hypothetical protein